MATNRDPKFKYVHAPFVPECLSFTDPEDAFCAAIQVNKTLEMLMAAMGAMAFVPDGVPYFPKGDNETFVDGIRRLFDYQLELIKLAGGYSSMPYAIPREDGYIPDSEWDRRKKEFMDALGGEVKA